MTPNHTGGAYSAAQIPIWWGRGLAIQRAEIRGPASRNNRPPLVFLIKRTCRPCQICVISSRLIVVVTPCPMLNALGLLDLSPPAKISPFIAHLPPRWRILLLHDVTLWVCLSVPKLFYVHFRSCLPVANRFEIRIN